MAKNVPHRLYLSEDQIPRQWYNLRADMKNAPMPMINPATGKEATLEDLYPVFCKELAQQELDNETRYIDIPDEVREIYKIYRPHRYAEHIIWRKHWIHRLKFIISSKAITLQEVIS